MGLLLKLLPPPRPSRRSRQASQTGPLPTNALLGAELREIRLITTLIPRGDPGSADFRTWLYLTKTQNKFTPLNLPLRGRSVDLRTAPNHNPKQLPPLSSSPCEGEVLTFVLHLTTTPNSSPLSQSPLRGGSADLRTAPNHNPKRVRALSSSPCEGEVLTFNLHLSTTQNRLAPSQAPPCEGGLLLMSEQSALAPKLAVPVVLRWGCCHVLH